MTRPNAITEEACISTAWRQVSLVSTNFYLTVLNTVRVFFVFLQFDKPRFPFTHCLLCCFVTEIQIQTVHRGHLSDHFATPD